MNMFRLAAAALACSFGFASAAHATAMYTASAGGDLTYQSATFASGGDASGSILLTGAAAFGPPTINVGGAGSSAGSNQNINPAGPAPLDVGDFLRTLVGVDGNATASATAGAFANSSVGLSGSITFQNMSDFDIIVAIMPDFRIDLDPVTMAGTAGEIATAQGMWDIQGSGDGDPFTSVRNFIIQSENGGAPIIRFGLPGFFITVLAGGFYTLDVSVFASGDAVAFAEVPLPAAALFFPAGIAGLWRASRRSKARAA